ncbi:23S rRNA (adenine(2503)-C(2))-methyltransferase RlmN [Clostridiisalibacter paucivorans]|uniref:23S rRNA (adenine(2503)-C(2))-methyltransferase RlmN n=1 Tax=Clostridiisalibacter paucivorans TaxID=408753 RepID=UPI00047E4334|nr:23S rRNA (adenine(2503)-C(2))-methyltransferase RlmN [Clostridiisalibacter paucivorans]
MEKLDLKSYTLKGLKDIFIKLGLKGYRGEQVFRAIHQKMVQSIDDILGLPKALRDKLKEKYYISDIKIFKRFDSKLDNTKKYLFMLEDGNLIESVVMYYKHGITVCISTQVGCKMGCEFCASTKDGFIRNMSSGEILDQIYKIQKDLDIKINNIVIMGSGEPLDNYHNVIDFLYNIHDAKGQNIGYRHIALSTCGIVPAIYKLADENIPITLSISLHASSNKEREKIMPIAKKYNIDELINACRYYINTTNRRITFEYTMVNGVNDRRKDAKELIDLLGGMLCHINIIPLNPVEESKLDRSYDKNIKKFVSILQDGGINATIRREMGLDINGACGQLRRDYMNMNDSR